MYTIVCRQNIIKNPDNYLSIILFVNHHFIFNHRDDLSLGSTDSLSENNKVSLTLSVADLEQTF